MDIKRILLNLWLPLAGLFLFLVSIKYRPLLPIDETRYMTVAWEMFLNHNWLSPLTLNFEPYHHKPPLLFWLINFSWSGLGISRWSGLIPMIISSFLCIYLTASLGNLLFPQTKDKQRTYLFMLSSIPFIIYSTLVMFDFTLCVFILSSLIFLLHYKNDGKFYHLMLAGLMLGLGVLTKGPVAYLYVLPIALLMPFWSLNHQNLTKWYGGIFCTAIISIFPILFWLIPVIKASNADFLHWLLWEQTAGRISGSFGGAHARPIWFYFIIIPLFFMPWVFFPQFWRNLSSLKNEFHQNEGLSFVITFIAITFILFSLIRGKQPHYLVPILPCVVLLIQHLLHNIKLNILVNVTATMLFIFFAGHVIASGSFFPQYDLRPISQALKPYHDRKLAFVRNYQGEIGFLGKEKKPIANLQMKDIKPWLKQNPTGILIIRHSKDQKEIEDLVPIISYEYANKYIGVYEKK